jgi:hypothetical protein
LAEKLPQMPLQQRAQALVSVSLPLVESERMWDARQRMTRAGVPQM